MKNNSQIIPVAMPFLYPFVVLFGLYISFNGADSPGGGFQGGAILCALIILNYVSDVGTVNREHSLHKLERIFLVLILMMGGFLLIKETTDFVWVSRMEFAIMNLLIAGKVACGLLIIFFRFVMVEGEYDDN